MAVCGLSGDDLDFLEEPSPDFLCPVTLELMLDPQQTLCCGNHVSREAAVKLQEESKPCPLCKEVPLRTVQDKFFGRKINELKVRCIQHSQGCEWMGEVGELQRHLNCGSLEGQCRFVALICPYSCGLEIQRFEMREHLESECQERPFTCEYCGHVATWGEVTTLHYELCQQYPLACPNKCGEGKIKRCHVLSHLNTCCPLEVIGCEFHNFGCTARLQRAKMADHKRRSVETHLSMAGATVAALQEQMGAVVALQQELKQLTSRLSSTVARLEGHANHSRTRSFTLDPSWARANRRPSGPPVLTPPMTFIMTGFSQYRARDDQWHSPPFYSHAGGYKFCLMVDANGHESQQHVSVHIFLMRGDHDDSLTWPFRY